MKEAPSGDESPRARPAPPRSPGGGEEDLVAQAEPGQGGVGDDPAGADTDTGTDPDPGEDSPLVDDPVPPTPGDDDLEVRVPSSLSWRRGYGSTDLTRDVIAGALVAILLIPQAFAYAQLAGLPPGVGIAAALVAPVVYAIFGGSRYLSIGPVALVSLLVGEALPEDGAAAAAMLLAGMVGVVLFLIGLFRAGFVFRVFTPPVLTGFIFAAAVVIATSQIGTITGIELPRGVPAVGLWEDVATSLDEVQAGSTILGAIVVLVLLAGPPVLRRALGVDGEAGARAHLVRALPLVVLLAAAGVVAAWGSTWDIETLGSVDLPSLLPRLPEVGDVSLPGLAVSAVTIALVAAVTSLAIADTLAGRDGSSISRSRELFSLGLASVAQAFFGGYPVGASLSRSAVVADSGGRSPVAAVLGAAILAVSALFLGPVLAAIPTAALSALIVSAAVRMIKPSEIALVWHNDLAVLIVMAIPFVAVLFLGVQAGLVAALVAGGMHLAWQEWGPAI